MNRAFTGVAVLFLPLFVFLKKQVKKTMKADTDTAIKDLGKQKHVKK